MSRECVPTQKKTPKLLDALKQVGYYVLIARQATASAISSPAQYKGDYAPCNQYLYRKLSHIFKICSHPTNELVLICENLIGRFTHKIHRYPIWNTLILRLLKLLLGQRAQARVHRTGFHVFWTVQNARRQWLEV